MTRPDFISAISQRLRLSRARAEAVARAVLATVRDGLNDDEATQVAAYLPGAIAEMIGERTGARPELPETGGLSFLAILRIRAGMESDRDAAHAVHAVFGAMMDASGVAGPRGAWDGLRHLPAEVKSIWMRIFRSANFPMERLAQRP